MTSTSPSGSSHFSRHAKVLPTASKAPWLFDRSPVCTLALARYLDHPVGPLLTAELDRVEREHIYDRSAFYIEPIGHLQQTAARTITYEDALLFGQIHRETYEQLGYHLVSVAAGPLTQRVRDAARGIARITQ